MIVQVDTWTVKSTVIVLIFLNTSSASAVSGSPLQSYTYHPRFPVISSGNELEEEHVLLLSASG